MPTDLRPSGAPGQRLHESFTSILAYQPCRGEPLTAAGRRAERPYDL